MTRTITPSRRILASFLATGVAVSSAALAAPAAFAQSAPSVTGGELVWGVKDSFRSYITGPIANGSAEPGDGASTDASGSYVFPAQVGTTLSGDTVEIPFQGSVHFTGHHGMLDLQISDFKVRLTNGSTDAALVADAVSNEFINTETTGAPITYSDVDIANVTLASAPDFSASSVDLTSTSVTLTAEGAPAFGNFWSEGQELNNTAGTVDLSEGAAPAGDSEPTNGGQSGATVVEKPTASVGKPASGASASSARGNAAATGSTDKELAETGVNEGAVAAFGLGLLVVLGTGVAIVRRQTIR